MSLKGDIMSEKTRIALLGPCGTTAYAWAAQILLNDLQDHPYFELAGLVAERSEDVGATFRTTMRHWFEERPLEPQYENLRILPADGDLLRSREDVRLVISSLPPDLSTELVGCLAATGMPVVSASYVWRDQDDIPLVVPEINPDHLSIIPAQKQRHNWDGFIVSNPVSTITILTLSMKPILDAFGIERAVITTLQAASGAGPGGPPAMAMIDNLIPFIPAEEEKINSEGRKIFGSLEADRIKPADFQISATCTRVPTRFGHMGAVFVQCRRPVTAERVAEAMRDFVAAPQDLGLPSAPPRSIIVTNVFDRPQPRPDRSPGNGKAVMVGRIRLDQAFSRGVKYLVTAHHLLRGTAGNNLLNAELLYKKRLLD
jgi:aspartate-semialdehyde dehydrogenase